MKFAAVDTIVAMYIVKSSREQVTVTLHTFPMYLNV